MRRKEPGVSDGIPSWCNHLRAKGACSGFSCLSTGHYPLLSVSAPHLFLGSACRRHSPAPPSPSWSAGVCWSLLVLAGCCCCSCIALVVSDSVRPHRQQPTRLPVPGILQARTLEWVAISFSNAWKWKVKVKSLSRVRLLATPWTCGLPGSSVHGIF